MANYYTYGETPDPKEAVYGPLSQGFADGGEVDEERFYVPRDENVSIPTSAPLASAAPGGIDRTAAAYSLFSTLGKTPSLGAATDATRPDPFGILSKSQAGTGGTDLEQGDLYDRLKAVEAQKTQGALEQFASRYEVTPEIQSALAQREQSAQQNLAAREQEYKQTLPQRQTLSNLLKSNDFKSAFDYAKKTGLEELLGNPEELKNLRQPFTREEAQQFMSAVPKDFIQRQTGLDDEKFKQAFDFDPATAGERNAYAWVDPSGKASDTGFPSLGSAYIPKADKPGDFDIMKAIAIGTALFGVGSLISGALGAASAGTSAASGALTGAKTAAKFLADIPSLIGEKVAGALGYNAIGSTTAKMIGNAVISGGLTGAKGGDFEDIIKSAALAAGLSYVSDKAIKAVAGGLQKSGVVDAISEIPGGDVTAIDPSVATDVASKVTQGLNQFTVTASKAADLAGKVGTGAALAASQIATDPSRAAPDKKIAPEDEIAAEYEQIYKRITPPDIPTGALDLYTKDIAKDYRPTEVEEPPVEEPGKEEEVVVRTSPDKLIDYTPPTGALDLYKEPFVPAPTVDGMQQIDVTTEPEKVDFTEPPAVVVTQPDIAKDYKPTEVDDTVKPPLEEEKPPLEEEKPPSDEEEVVIRTSPDKPLDFTPPTPIVVDPADIAKDYKPTEVKKPEDSEFQKLIDKYGTFENFLKILGALGAAGSKTPTAPVTTPTVPSMGGALPKYEIKRTQLRPDIDYYTYGTRPEAKFFDYGEQVIQPVQPALPTPPPADVNPPDENKPMAYGGLTGYSHGGSHSSRYVDGPGSGRDDKIPALLSDGEYVIDAETLALLGDGSTKEGAKRLDEFRANIRRHKGQALSRGQISPNAKSPEKYMGGGLT